MTPAEIAARLSPAQKRALAMLPVDPNLAIRGTRAMATLDYPNINRGRPLAYSHGVTPFWSIAPLGLAVRAEIERMEKQDGE
jgi:hypothetical protein